MTHTLNSPKLPPKPEGWAYSHSSIRWNSQICSNNPTLLPSEKKAFSHEESRGQISNFPRFYISLIAQLYGKVIQGAIIKQQTHHIFSSLLHCFFPPITQSIFPCRKSNPRLWGESSPNQFRDTNTRNNLVKKDNLLVVPKCSHWFPSISPSGSKAYQWEMKQLHLVRKRPSLGTTHFSGEGFTSQLTLLPLQ